MLAISALGEPLTLCINDEDDDEDDDEEDRLADEIDAKAWSCGNGGVSRSPFPPPRIFPASRCPVPFISLAFLSSDGCVEYVALLLRKVSASSLFSHAFGSLGALV